MEYIKTKRYFLSELERESYENCILNNHPELKRDFILQMDDEELLERLNIK
ncbi:hypothetical protein [Metabacillus arenae]|uniref:Uncharacterized protein n=1 Tax=Metabacillus arenae TaxID=2771434 RepID=A0A926NC85_9BACI|nr:hypothetical protein [Metabacillus arenae]MBD1380849.1 hypothetical protein [Metabacillus arenae]